MNEYQQILSSHEKLNSRRSTSELHVEKIRQRAQSDAFLGELDNIEIFVAGSIGRLESGKKSDLDVFITSSDNQQSQLTTYKLMASIININNDLGFPEFSNDGMYLKVQPIGELISATGSPIDDSENLFTTRMLLLLESRYVLHQDLYDEHLRIIIDNYFRDAVGRTTEFKPLFILNDLLRYWRTLCLNYEGIRNNTSKPWRKKNINLKFSRMLTVFGTIIPLLEGGADKIRFIELCKLTPLERLSSALRNLNPGITPDRFAQFLDDYEMFLALKEDDAIEQRIQETPDLQADIDKAAERFSLFIYPESVSVIVQAEH